MATTAELIQELYERRMNLVAQSRELLAQVEAKGQGMNGEDQQKWDGLQGDIDALGKRIDSLLALQETNKDLDEQRARFEKVVRPEQRTDEGETAERMRAFLRAALPESDTWAPRAITFKIDQATKDAVMARSPLGGASAYPDVRADLTKGVTTAGGFTVPTGFVARLYEHLVENAAMRQTGTTILTTDSGEDLPVPKTTSHGANATIVAEGAAIPEADPALGQVTMKAWKYGKLIQVSTELAQDTGVDLLGYLARAAGLAIGLGAGADYVTGTPGTAQPEGATTNVTTGKLGATGQTTTVTSDDLIDLFHSIVSGYRNRGVWLMLDASLAKVRKLKDTTGQYIWQPGLQAGVPDLLLGRPVVTDPAMPAMAANAKSVLFGDFSLYYTIRDVSAVRFERSEEFAFANDLITFRALARTDGRPIDTTAVKAYVNSAT